MREGRELTFELTNHGQGDVIRSRPARYAAHDDPAPCAVTRLPRPPLVVPDPSAGHGGQILVRSAVVRESLVLHHPAARRVRRRLPSPGRMAAGRPETGRLRSGGIGPCWRSASGDATQRVESWTRSSGSHLVRSLDTHDGLRYANRGAALRTREGAQTVRNASTHCRVVHPQTTASGRPNDHV
jgi:hypothetical protein